MASYTFISNVTVAPESTFGTLGLSSGKPPVLTPFMMCMALSVWFVNIIPEDRQCYEDTDQLVLPYICLERGSTLTYSSSKSSSIVAISFISIFFVLMIFLTFLIICSYDTGRRRVGQIWLHVVVCLLLSWVGVIYILTSPYRTPSTCIGLHWSWLCGSFT